MSPDRTLPSPDRKEGGEFQRKPAPLRSRLVTLILSACNEQRVSPVAGGANCGKKRDPAFPGEILRQRQIGEHVLLRLLPSILDPNREVAPNFRGLKVSDTPWERFAEYLLEGLDVFVGPEALISQGLAAGAGGGGAAAPKL